MPRITIDWRSEDSSVFGYVRVEAFGAPKTELRAFEIREAEPNRFTVISLKDGREIGAAWKSLPAAKVIALTSVFQVVETHFGQPLAHGRARGLKRRQLG